MALPTPVSRPTRVFGPRRHRPIAQIITPAIRERAFSPDEIDASRHDGFHDALLGVLFPRWP